MTDPWYVAAFGAHYPLLYAHRDEQEAADCLDLLPRLAPLGPGPVLDLGCGDGRHLEILAREGMSVVGLDLSAHLLAAARRRLGTGPGAPPLVRGDMMRLPLRTGSTRAVLSLFTAFGYLGPLAANAPVVAEISRVLAPGGHWFLDYFDGERVARELRGRGPLARHRELGPCRVAETRVLEPGSGLVAKQVELSPLPGSGPEAAALGIGPGGLRYREQVALFTRAELDELAAAHRLRRVAGVGSYRGAPLGQGDRWILVFRRSGSRSEGAE